MNIAKTVSILIALEAERVANEILDANEGFDGEIEPTDLAQRVIKSMAGKSSPALAPAIPASTPAPRRARGEGKVCNRCGQNGLVWQRIDGRWILHASDGSRHSCQSAASKPVPKPEERVSREHWNNLIEIFTELKGKGVSRAEAPDTLDYDSDQEGAPQSVINKALDRVYGRKEASPVSFMDELKRS